MNSLFVKLDIFRASSLTFNEVYQHIISSIKYKKKLLLFPLNLHSLRLIHENFLVKSAYENADIVFADGVPILLLARLAGNPLPGRVSGTDLVKKILCTPSLKVFLLGSEPNVLKIIKKKYHSPGGANITGSAHPSVNSNGSAASSQKILQHMRKTKPDVLLVALGQPKQELWLRKNFYKIPTRIGMGVGSAFDILSNKSPRAPSLLQFAGMEWLWRLILEPRRLFFRYFMDGFIMISFVIKFLIKSKKSL